MSGIVRGYSTAHEMLDIALGSGALIHANPYHIKGEPLPVAVVPLDDATLAGMAEKIARVDFAHSDYGTWEATSQSHRTAFIDVALKGLRAALGIGGEPSTNATEPRG